MCGVQCVCLREGYSQVRFEERVDATMRCFERCGWESLGFFGWGDGDEVSQWMMSVSATAARRGRMAKLARRCTRRDVRPIVI